MRGLSALVPHSTGASWASAVNWDASRVAKLLGVLLRTLCTPSHEYVVRIRQLAATWQRAPSIVPVCCSSMVPKAMSPVGTAVNIPPARVERARLSIARVGVNRVTHSRASAQGAGRPAMCSVRASVPPLTCDVHVPVAVGLHTALQNRSSVPRELIRTRSDEAAWSPNTNRRSASFDDAALCPEANDRYGDALRALSPCRP
jgi:hypothetical protein